MRNPISAFPENSLLNCTSDSARVYRLPIQFQPSEAARSESRLDETGRILDAAAAILSQGEDLLRALSAESFQSRVPVVFNASIGGHYRHCLDHFTSFLRGLPSGDLNYDHRERDPRIESQPAFALAATRRIRAQLEQLPPAWLALPARARCEVSYAQGDSPVTESTFARELVYAIAHAIHHYALIAVMARLLQVELPLHFGVAPSTVAHKAGSAHTGVIAEPECVKIRACHT